MKNTKKAFAVLLALLMVSAMTLGGCGEDDDDGGGKRKKPTEEGTLETGEKLCKALKIGSELPKSVNLTEQTDNGTDMYMTMDAGHIQNFMNVLSEVTIGDYKGTTKEKKLNSLKLKWSDGKEIEILYSEGRFIYKTDDGNEEYKLTGKTLKDAAEALRDDVEASGLVTVTCKELGFKTKASSVAQTEYDEDAGFYIGVGPGTPSNVPYVLIYRYRDAKCTAAQYFEQMGIPFFKENYGNDLISYSDVEKLDAQLADGTEKTFYGCTFTYEAYGNRLCAYRLVGQFGSDIIYFTAKYADGDDDMMNDAMETLENAAIYFSLTDGSIVSKPEPTDTPKPTGSPNPDGRFKVVASPASQVTYVKYDNGLFSAQVPKGWVVETHDKSDYIHYTFQIYDPQNPNLRIVYNMQTSDYWATKADYDFYHNLYPTSILCQNPWLEEQSTMGILPAFFKAVIDGNYFTFRRLSGFEKIETLGKDPFGGEIIHATALDPDGKKVEGIFGCSFQILNMYYVNFANVYGMVMMTAPEGELSNWIEVFEHVYGSIEYSQFYQTELNKQLIASGQATREIARICSQTTDIVISGWESRQAAYDRISQKQSDATLGYERVYDTEKNEIYRAPLDFFDNYSGSRYQPVTDNQYLLPIDGYIQWK
ncbi:MAG: hypothetical protein J5648_09380 [Lachnospiraceae bacterium]|nr:hypothetical protein [Lachnospiraceae bacterium]